MQPTTGSYSAGQCMHEQQPHQRCHLHLCRLSQKRRCWCKFMMSIYLVNVLFRVQQRLRWLEVLEEKGQEHSGQILGLCHLTIDPLSESEWKWKFMSEVGVETTHGIRFCNRHRWQRWLPVRNICTSRLPCSWDLKLWKMYAFCLSTLYSRKHW